MKIHLLALAIVLSGCAASGGGYVVGNGIQPKGSKVEEKKDLSTDDKTLEKCKTGKKGCGNKKAACSESSEAASGCKL